MKTNYYLEKYKDYNPYYFQILEEAETKGEKESIKKRIIDDIKKQEYPKYQTKLIINYIKTL